MTEQEKLDYVDLHGQRPPEEYFFIRISYKTGSCIAMDKKTFATYGEAKIAAQELANNVKDEGKIILLYRFYPKGDTVNQEFIMFQHMYWPQGILQDMEMFFEIA